MKHVSSHTGKIPTRLNKPTMVPWAFELVLLKIILLVHTACTIPQQKTSSIKDLTFHKSYGAWSKVKKPTSYEVPYDDEVRTVSTDNENNYNYFNIFTDSKSNDKTKENFFKNKLMMKSK